MNPTQHVDAVHLARATVRADRANEGVLARAQSIAHPGA